MFSGGDYFTGSNIMDCSYVTNPDFLGNSLLAISNDCMTTGWDISPFNGLDTSINYTFGTHIYKQTLPYRYDVTDLLELPAQYDSGKYIAEIFAIRDTQLE